MKSNDYKIIYIPQGKKSPMENHRTMEIAADDTNKIFYVHELMAACYGTKSIETACNTYKQRS